MKMPRRPAATAVPLLLAIASAAAVDAQALTAPRFDAASIRPTSQEGPDVEGLGDVRILPGGRVVAEKAQLRYFIRNAYDVKPFQLLGGPAWINSAHYEIDAKAEGNPDNSQMRLLMQSLLAERFQLKIHHETRRLPVYELIAAKGGIKLPSPQAGNCDLYSGSLPCGRVMVAMSPRSAQLRGARVTMAELVRVLSNAFGQTVADKTGFTALFDVHLEFTPDSSLAGIPPLPPHAASAHDAEPIGSIFAAIQAQLGLKLLPAKGRVDVIVIDSIERPSEN